MNHLVQEMGLPGDRPGSPSLYEGAWIGERGVLGLFGERPADGEERIALERLTCTVDAGETAEFSFFVVSGNGHPIEGFVLTDEPRLRVLVPKFFGAEEEIGFSFSGIGLRGGDRVEGHLTVISDCGEAQIAVSVVVRTPYPPAPDGSEEEMKNLFHFANLARRDFAAAVQLFHSPRMALLFHGGDRKYRNLYRGLTGDRGEGASDRAAGVEEFLIGIHKKDPVEYSLDRTDLSLEGVREDMEEAVSIIRRGWGYVRLEVETEGDFLVILRQELSERDFLGNACRLPVMIRHGALHEGKNYGRIRVRGMRTDLTVEVCAVRGEEPGRQALRTERRKKRELEYRLIRGYVDYRLGKRRSREWLVSTGKIISQMNALAPNDVRFALYTVHYLITASRETEAVWVLDKVRTSVEETVSYGEVMRAYFLYLETLLSRDERKISAVEEILNGMLVRHPEDWRITWLMQFLMDDRPASNARRMRLYEEQFRQGCRSPILYIEAIDLLGRDPSYLKRVEPFTLYVLSFAARHRALPKALIDRVVWLLMREKHGSGPIYRILRACHEADPESGAAEAICALLIKDARTDGEAFSWYQRAVVRGSRITRLLEYYMASFPEGKREIPRQVLLYFSYKTELPYEKKTLLYRYVIGLREAEPELYRAYVPQMEQFVAEQMAKGRIDRALCRLYSHFCVLQPQDAAMARHFFEVLYTVEQEVDPRARRVVVVYDRLSGERSYPVTDRKASFPLYSEHAAIFWEDARGNRFLCDASGRRPPMVRECGPQMLREVLPFLQEGRANVDLYLTEEDRLTVTAENADRCRRLAESEEVSEVCRTGLARSLILFYYDHDFIRQLADFLPHAHLERMAGKERGEILDMMVHAGLYGAAFELVDRFGLTGISERTAYRLVSRAIARGEYPETETACMLAWAAFRMGKYDEGTLSCLVRDYSGLIKQELAVFRACGSFSVDAAPLAAHMLSQLLFTGGHEPGEDKLFQAVVQEGGRTRLQVAWLSRAAAEDLYQQAPISAFAVERIRVMALSGEELPSICRLAYLKYHAEEKRKGDLQVTASFLSALSEAETGLPFLYAYRDRLPSLALADGKRYVQYASAPGRAVMVHLRRGEGEEAVRRMKEPYPGFYIHGEVLFPGEEVRYYITEGKEGETEIRASGTLACGLDQDAPAGESRYAILSRLVLARVGKDRAAAKEELYTYYKNAFLSEKLFPLPEE